MGLEPTGTDIATGEIPDEDIELAIERELVLQPGIFGEIEASSSKGIVTLTGTTKNILTKERAARIAEMVKGVRAIINKIDMDIGEISDADIHEQLELAFFWDPALESQELKTEVKDGVVDLYGKVQSWEERQLASTVAKSVSGVKQVNNNIVFDYTDRRNDQEIAEEVIQSLRWDLLVDDALIDVIVNDGKVTLTGVVGSLAEKSQAKIKAYVTGVDSVDVSQLNVERWARDKDLREGKYLQKSDEAIKEAIFSTFMSDPTITAYYPDIEVSEGIVALTGHVNSLQAKQNAESNALSVVGVVKVDNQLKVQPLTSKSDESIKSRITSAMAWDPVLETYQISVSVEEGKVELKGTVDSYYEKYKAAEVAARTLGVTEVDNGLQVSNWSPYHYDYDYYYYHHTPAVPLAPRLNDQEIQDAIEAQFYWSPYVNEDEIVVSVTNGTVTLSGAVDFWEEKRRAELEAFDGGAINVENNITVRNHSAES